MDTSVVFDRAAGFYDDTRGFPHGTEQHVAEKFQIAGRITEATRIVEPGIGTGRIALPLAKLSGATVVGVDLSAPMLQQLRQKQENESVYTVQGDAMRIPLQPNAFDIAIITHVFHLIPDWQAALLEISRLLKPSGLLLYSWTTHENTHFLDTWRRVLKKRTGIGYENFSSSQFLDEAGWQIAGEVQHVTYYADRTPQDYIDSLVNRIWSSTWSMSGDEIAQGIAQLRSSASDCNLPLNETLRQEVNFHIAPYTPSP